ncbi:MAG: hypothetical protein ACO2OT_04705 [Candidatus Caldipriscus sp.]
MKPMRGRAKSLQKSWRALSAAFVFSCLESFRDYSDWDCSSTQFG